jgi:hypothetical protein
MIPTPELDLDAIVMSWKLRVAPVPIFINILRLVAFAQ